MSRFYLVMLLVIAPFFNGVLAQHVPLEDAIYSLLVDDELKYLEASESLKIDAIIQAFNESEFKQYSGDQLEVGKVYWSFFQVKNTSNADLSYVLGFETARQADYLDVYVLDSGQIIQSLSTGRLLSYEDRSYQDGHHTYLKITIPKGESYQLFLRQKQETEAFAPLKLGYILIPYEKYLKSKVKNRLYQGFYIGFIVVMLLYNLFVFFSVSDWAYFYYVLFLLGAFLVSMQLFGLGMESLWASLPQVDIFLNFYLLPTWTIAYILFVQKFLQTANHVPIWNKILLGLKVIGFLLVSLALFGGGWLLNYLYLYAVITMFINIAVAAVVFKKGYKPAVYFLLANLLFIAGVCLYILRAVDIIPTTWITIYSIQIGSGMEMVLFSLGLADRINRIQEDLYQANLEKETLAREKQEEERVAIERQNRNLEEQILARTAMIMEQKSQIEQQNTRLEEALEIEKLQVEEMEATQAKMLEAFEQLKATQSQLVQSEKMASLGLMTAGIAHEINNPLNFIYAGVETLEDLLQELMHVYNQYEKLDIVYKDREKVRALAEGVNALKEEIRFDLIKEDIPRMIKEIRIGAERASEIIKGLRLFARGEDTENQLIDIHELIETALVLLQNLLKDKVEIIKDYNRQAERIECHPSQLTQVFMNLIANGVQAITDEGKIYISTKRQQNDLEIIIRDTGCGIPDNIKDKIFEPFFTTKEVGEGTGLGLSISYGIIQQHGGSINLESKVGEGTTFFIRLPIQVNP